MLFCLKFVMANHSPIDEIYKIFFSILLKAFYNLVLTDLSK